MSESQPARSLRAHAREIGRGSSRATQVDERSGGGRGGDGGGGSSGEHRMARDEASGRINHFP